MATLDQQNFIKDLVLKKFRDFKEFKKWLATTGIVRTNGQIFTQGVTLPALTNKITNAQGSKVIDALQDLDDVTYLTAYDRQTITEVQSLIKSIEMEVDSWTFPNN